MKKKSSEYLREDTKTNTINAFIVPHKIRLNTSVKFVPFSLGLVLSYIN